MFIAVLLPLGFANRWAIQFSALLSGVGIGLFIDELGKFITQTNDYFYPPALSLIYAFFLLNLFAYVSIRKRGQQDGREAMYHVLDEIKDALDGDLDQDEAARIEAHLAIAKQSKREEFAELANALDEYLQKEKGKLVLQWRTLLIIIQSAVGILMIAALIAWFTGNENAGIRFSIGGLLLSLVALQTLYFYITQFSAIIAAILQLLFLQVLYSYRLCYLESDTNR